MTDNQLRMLQVGAWVVLAFGAVVYVYQYARSIDKTFPSKTFTVDGTADIDVTPDVATFSVTVLSEGGQNVAELQSKNTEKMNSVTTLMKEAGVKGSDLKTFQYNLAPRYTNPICQGGVCPQPTIVGYTLTQTLQVKVRDTGKLGDLLTGAVEKGANSVSDVQFVVDDDTKAKDEARAEAMKEAREKAEMVAKNGGFRLGKLVTLYEMNDPGIPQPYYGGMGGDSMSSAQKSAVAPMIEPGTIPTKLQVTMTYEILP